MGREARRREAGGGASERTARWEPVVGPCLPVARCERRMGGRRDLERAVGDAGLRAAFTLSSGFCGVLLLWLCCG